MASSSRKRYDVFISFRGEDTRSNFVSHLHSALKQHGIRAFMDDSNIKKGDEVWPSLSRAIPYSYVAIVVFSENYAFSTWCLKELVHIMECRKSEGLVVIPVFYKVDPSHIRNHVGRYGDAIAELEKDYDKHRDSIKKWKAALTEAANISGWDSLSRGYKNEAEMIQKIVKDVLEKLELRSPATLKVKDLVQIDKICEEVKCLFSKNQNVSLPYQKKRKKKNQNVQVIGIWGMGGMGKTTIAKVLFSQLFSQYDGVCFLANVREESKRLGLASLHGKLLSELLKDEHHGSDVATSTYMTRRLRNKKVLVVLDDVDSSDQYDELCEECKHAGPDSKIIVTTRDRHILIRARVDEIYQANALITSKSLELFCLYAFKQKFPKKGYDNLSRKAVEYAGGVPLALKVLGSNLYRRDLKFWDSELSKLKCCPDDKIQRVLEVSYDGLNTLQQKIFLDISFFFKDRDKDDVIRILDACDLYASSGVQVLVDKALINISHAETIQMHDLTQEMGFHIVRQKEAEKRSHLSNIKEVSDILQNNRGSDAVEGIKLDLSEIDDLHLNYESFSKLKDLRILILHNPLNKKSGKVSYPRALNKISDNLRYLEWNGCGLESLPASFSAKMLVELRMPHSHVTKLWEGVQDVANLVLIDLSECKQLENLPDLSKASKLRKVNLSGCEKLTVVHPSVLCLGKLKTFILDGCKKLESLKSEKRLKSLRKISVDGCTSLREFSVWSDSIKRLDLSNTGMKKLDSSIGLVKNLEYLKVYGLRHGNLPSELSSLKGLTELLIFKCKLAIDKEKLHAVFDGLTSLQVLHLKDCCNLCELPDNLSNLSNLKELRLDGSSVNTLPASFKDLKYLETLSIVNCRELVSLPKLPPSVSKLKAKNCTSLVTVSSLNTRSDATRKSDIFISFENCTSLDKDSLDCITEDAFSAVSSIMPKWKALYAKSSRKACFPGSSVPGKFHRTGRSSFTISLPSMEADFGGLIFCAILSPYLGKKTDRAKICCQCYLPDGTKLGDTTTWHHETVKLTELKSDHVYMWCDQRHFNSILQSYYTGEQQVNFKFFLTIDNGENNLLTIPTKECGLSVLQNPIVSLVYDAYPLYYNLPMKPIYYASETEATESSCVIC